MWQLPVHLLDAFPRQCLGEKKKEKERKDISDDNMSDGRVLPIVNSW